MRSGALNTASVNARLQESAFAKAVFSLQKTESAFANNIFTLEN